MNKLLLKIIKIYNILNQRDKKLHLMVGMGISMVSYICFDIYQYIYGDLSELVVRTCVISIVIICALAKEEWDKTLDSNGKPRGTYDVVDFIATVLGGIIGLVYCTVLYAVVYN